MSTVKSCAWCGELVLETEQDVCCPGQPMHSECGFRAICGSVAHLLKRCNCFVPGSQLGDPPNLSKRDAALATRRLWQQIQEWFPEHEL